VTAYELMLILDPEVDEARQEEVVHRVRDIILTGGGSWDAIDPWGRRKLAYPINKREEGDYWVIRFTSDAASLAEAERVLRITDEVLRHQSVHQARPSRKTEAAAGS
jgi:small subunit ribosomal protein S6